jgi:hypothetical protein
VGAVKPPDSIVICGHAYSVELVADRDAPLSRHTTSTDPVGHSDHERGRITVRATDELSADMVRDTMLHEVIHAVIELTYLNDDFRNRDAMERVTNGLATHLLDTLRRNPQLVAFLMADSIPSERSRGT